MKTTRYTCSTSAVVAENNVIVFSGSPFPSKMETRPSMKLISYNLHFQYRAITQTSSGLAHANIQQLCHTIIPYIRNSTPLFSRFSITVALQERPYLTPPPQPSLTIYSDARAAKPNARNAQVSTISSCIISVNSASVDTIVSASAPLTLPRPYPLPPRCLRR